jgi:hypothetical protein
VRSGNQERREPLWEDDPSSERLLLDAIASGELDEHLTAIAEAIRTRRELLHTVEAAKAFAGFAIGDTVRFNRRIRPRYLNGEPSTITELEDGWVTVRLWRPVGRFTSADVRCPPLALEKVRPGSSRSAA